MAHSLCSRWVPPSADPIIRACERCGTYKGVQLVPSMTAYVQRTPTVWDRICAEDGGLTPTPNVLPDPNPPSWLCPECAKDYQEYWEEQWAEYYSGLL